jgi:hypothetical protein
VQVEDQGFDITVSRAARRYPIFPGNCGSNLQNKLCFALGFALREKQPAVYGAIVLTSVLEFSFSARA